MGVALGGLHTVGSALTLGQHSRLSPTVGVRGIGTSLAAPFLLPTSSYWQNNRAADVPNSQRGHPLYLNRHHESLLKLNPAFQAWAAQPSLPATVNRLRTTLPRTYNVLHRLGMIDQGQSGDPGQIRSLARDLQSF